MPTNTTTPFLTIAQHWPRLEPAIDPDSGDARTIHGKLPPNITYPAGQILGPVTAVAGRYAAPGTGVGPANRILEYPVTTDADGNCYLGPTINLQDVSFDTVPMWYQGKFFLKDLTGLGSDDTIMNQLGKLVQGVGRTDVAAIIKL